MGLSRNLEGEWIYDIARRVAVSADKQTASAEEVASAAGGLTEVMKFRF